MQALPNRENVLYGAQTTHYLLKTNDILLVDHAVHDRCRPLGLDKNGRSCCEGKVVGLEGLTRIVLKVIIPAPAESGRVADPT